MKFEVIGRICIAIAGLLWPMTAAIGQSDAIAARPVLQADSLPPGAERRLGTNRLRMANPVEKLSFSSDDSTLFADFSGYRYAWHAPDWKPSARKLIDQTVHSADGQHFAKLRSRYFLEVWDAKRNALIVRRDLREFINDPPFSTIEFHPASDAIWIHTARDGLRLFDWSKNEVVKTIKLPESLYYISMMRSPDRKVFAICTKWEQFAIFDAGTGDRLCEFSIDPEGGGGGFNRDGTIFATHDKNGLVLWDATNGKPLVGIPKELGLPSLRSAFATKGARVLFYGNDLTLFDLASKRIIARAELDGQAIVAAAFSNDDKQVAIASRDGTIELRDAATLQPILNDPHPRGPALRVAFSRDGKSLATFHYHKTAVRVWNVGDGSVTRAYEVDATKLDDKKLWSLLDPPTPPLGFSHDGQSLELGSAARWDLAKDTGERRPLRDNNLLRASADGQRRLVFELDEKKNATAVSLVRVDGKAEVIKLPLETPNEFVDPVNGLRAAMSAKGDVVAVSTHRTKKDDEISQTGEFAALAVWRIDGSRLVPTFRKDIAGCHHCAMTADGRLLAVVGQPTVANPHQIVQLATGVPLWSQTREFDTDERTAHRRGGYVVVHSAGNGVAFSPNGQFIAWHGQKSVLVREALSGSLVVKFNGHEGAIVDLAFSPDGRLLATASIESTVMLWKIPIFPGGNPGVWNADRADSLWSKLGGEVFLAHRAIADLHAGGDEAVAFLKSKVRIDLDADRALVRQAVDDLGSKQFAVREKAVMRLQSLGFRLHLFIADAMAQADNLEQKRRLVGIADSVTAAGIDPDSLRHNRIVFLLERMGTPAARDLLETIARGHRLDLAAESARSALARLRTTN